MEDNSYLTKEQLRYIRRLSKSKLSKPQDILPMIDLISRLYKREKSYWNPNHAWKRYEHDIKYVLYYWPYLEVHLHVANQDPKLMKNLYAGLENFASSWDYYEKTPHNKKVYDGYLAIKYIIPIVRDVMVIVG